MTTEQTPSQPAPESSPKRTFPIWGIAALLLALLVLLSTGYLNTLWHSAGVGVDMAPHGQDEGTSDERPRAPEINFISDKGQVSKLQDFKGKVVLLSFWASWCGPCLEELPTFSNLARKYRDKGFEVIALNVDESQEEAKAFIPEFWKNKALPFPAFFDVANKASHAFNIDVLPANYVLDRQGRIAFTGLGSSDWSSPEVSESIEELLDESI